jgi:hypothetical protein
MLRFARILLLLLLACVSAYAQKTTTYTELLVIPKNAVMVNLGGLALDYLNLSYYRALNDHSALGAYFGYLYHPVGNERITGYGYGLAYRYFPAGKAISRFYYSPIVGIQMADALEGRHPLTTGVLLSGLVGWQWFPEQVFAVGLAVGARVIVGRGALDPVVSNAFGASPIITLDLGYGWP